MALADEIAKCKKPASLYPWAAAARFARADGIENARPRSLPHLAIYDHSRALRDTTAIRTPLLWNQDICPKGKHLDHATFESHGDVLMTRDRRIRDLDYRMAPLDRDIRPPQ